MAGLLSGSGAVMAKSGPTGHPIKLEWKHSQIEHGSHRPSKPPELDKKHPTNNSNDGWVLGALRGTGPELTQRRIQNISRIIRAARTAYPDNATMASMAASQAMVEEGPDLKTPRFKKKKNCLGIMVPGRSVFASFKSLEACLLGHRAHMGAPVYKAAWHAARRGDLTGTIKATFEAGYAGDPQYVGKVMRGFSTYIKPVMLAMDRK